MIADVEKAPLIARGAEFVPDSMSAVVHDEALLVLFVFSREAESRASATSVKHEKLLRLLKIFIHAFW